MHHNKLVTKTSIKIRVYAVALLAIISAYFFQQSIHWFSHGYHTDKIAGEIHTSSHANENASLNNFSKKAICLVCDNIFKISPFSIYSNYKTENLQFYCNQFFDTEPKFCFQFVWNIASRGPPAIIL